MRVQLATAAGLWEEQATSWLCLALAGWNVCCWVGPWPCSCIACGGCTLVYAGWLAGVKATARPANEVAGAASSGLWLAGVGLYPGMVRGCKAQGLSKLAFSSSC